MRPTSGTCSCPTEGVEMTGRNPIRPPETTVDSRAFRDDRALLTSSMIPRAPQAIEVVGDAEQQGLANLRCQAAPRSARRKLAFDHRENSFHLGAWPIVFLWKGPVHLVPKGSLGNAPARVGWDDTPRAQALSNVLVVGFGIEFGIPQHHSDGYASSCRIHQPRQSPCVAP